MYSNRFQQTLHKSLENMSSHSLIPKVSMSSIRSLFYLSHQMLTISLAQRNNQNSDDTGNIEYLTLDLVCWLKFGKHHLTTHIKNISHLFNLSTQTGNKYQQFCPRCCQHGPLKEYNAHICKCYKTAQIINMHHIARNKRYIQEVHKATQVCWSTLHCKCRHWMPTTSNEWC